MYTIRHIYLEDIYDSKTIIDDTLIFSNHIPTVLHYLSCVAQVFTNYCPAQSKFNFIKQWHLSPHDVYLLSFISLCLFYKNYIPWFKSNIKPIHRLQHLYHRQTLSLLAWSPQLIDVFENCKTNLVTLPLLFRYDSSKHIFLKTYCSTSGMEYILV